MSQQLRALPAPRPLTDRLGSAWKRNIHSAFSSIGMEKRESDGAAAKSRP